MLSLDILGNHGALSKVIEGFTPRQSQLQMAEAIERALELKGSLIVEAGTGTGKTFGYLVPIFLSQKKTIISTGTKNLQEQLFYKDIPIIKKIFSLPLKVILLKGRANYLCLYRLEQNMQDGRFNNQHEVSQLVQINEWSNHTQQGDISEVSGVPEDSNLWPRVTSTPDNCLNQDCAFYEKCFVIKARKEALNADILIVNHHLFFADLALQKEGFGELLPGAEVTIFDEAHHLPDIATQFFSTRLSSRQLLELARDSEVEAEKDAKDMKILFDVAGELQQCVSEMRLAFGHELKRAAWPGHLEEKLEPYVQSVNLSLQKLEASLKEASQRSRGLENCWRRALSLIELFNSHTHKNPDDFIHWYETFSQSFSIQLTPLKVAEQFKTYIKANQRTWVFTSATLTVKDNFKLFTDALGLDNALCLQLKSPFNYSKQALLYVPRGLPDPRDAHYITQMVETIIPVIEITKGRAFILFTSYKALDLAYLHLSSRLTFPMLVQGHQSKQQLIEEFKTLENAVLLGTSSFWYGVDVKGEALSCVIIDKLPFAAPDDPILQSRIKLLRQQGLDPFQAYQLPAAVLILKQGVGRLIRDSQDRGVLMICDPRLVGSRYGETFINSLPNMNRTRDLTKVIEFFEKKVP